MQSIEAITDFTIPFGYRNESLEVAKLTYRSLKIELNILQEDLEIGRILGTNI